jgi:hypothetical protein
VALLAVILLLAMAPFVAAAFAGPLAAHGFAVR